MADVLVLGAGGQVGQELLAAAWPAGVQVAGKDRSSVDITNAAAVDNCLAANRSRVVINAAAYTAVDRAEDDSAAALAVNAQGAEALAIACARHDATLIHLSTDYVFDGSKPGAYAEDDPTMPLNAYGASKLAGENLVRRNLDSHVIVRTSWIFSAYGSNFVKTMLRLGRERSSLQIVEDQIGCPTAASDIAGAIIRIAGRAFGGDMPRGTFHFCGAPAVSWYDFATSIFSAAAATGQRVPHLAPVPSSTYPLIARRPANSVLDCSRIKKAFGIAQPRWQTGLRQVVERVVLES